MSETSAIDKRLKPKSKIKRDPFRLSHQPLPEDMIDIEQLQRLAGLNLSLQHIAWWFGLSEEAFVKVVRNRPDMIAAYRKGQATRAAVLHNKLHELLQEGNPAAIMFALRCMGYSEKSQGMGPIAPNGSNMDDVLLDVSASESSSSKAHGVLVVPAVAESMEAWESGAVQRQADLQRHASGRASSVASPAGQPSGLPVVPGS